VENKETYEDDKVEEIPKHLKLKYTEILEEEHESESHLTIYSPTSKENTMKRAFDEF